MYLRRLVSIVVLGIVISLCPIALAGDPPPGFPSSIPVEMHFDGFDVTGEFVWEADGELYLLDGNPSGSIERFSVPGPFEGQWYVSVSDFLDEWWVISDLFPWDGSTSVDLGDVTFFDGWPFGVLGDEVAVTGSFTVPVPEPATVTPGILCLALLASRRRLRKASTPTSIETL